MSKEDISKALIVWETLKQIDTNVYTMLRELKQTPMPNNDIDLAILAGRMQQAADIKEMITEKLKELHKELANDQS